MAIDKEIVTARFELLQNKICTALERIDGKVVFQEDKWERPGGGGGKTRVINNGHVIEKGGVNFSAVFGETPEKIAKALQLPPSDFYATGVSIVIHPESPRVPIIHMNIRYFEMSNGTWWFGGGIDLTPHYVVDKDVDFFHDELKKVCDRHSSEYHPQFKQWADDYFYIKHRKESRGIGGIFFDRLTEDEGFSLEDRFNFVIDVGEAFVPIYEELIHRNKKLPYGEREKRWQELRRGRYVEFNLVYDKGTKFGLDTDGRTESILMSLPPRAQWAYDFTPEPGSEEERTINFLQGP